LDVVYAQIDFVVINIEPQLEAGAGY